MRYVSTRGASEPLGFGDVLASGMAPDGGLYMPEHWPRLPASLAEVASRPFGANAYEMLRPLVGDAFTDGELREDIGAAYSCFDDPAVVPLRQLGQDRYLLELFHGPTLAFKDIALQVIGRLLARRLNKLGARATVIVATSGDTGSAAIAALRGLSNIDIVVLHPKGRVSDVQRRQMTTVADANVHNVALEGTFDDTQNVVKALFADRAFTADVALTAVNSINFARIAVQAVYYVTAAAALPREGLPSFVVPTGNFGDVFAGEAASRMGLAVGRLVVATNTNDILTRALATGVYRPETVRPSLSPSMDIQVASNFERALFEASGRDAAWVATAMAEFAQARALTLSAKVLEALRGRYAAARADDAQTLAAIKRVYDTLGVIVDPHTAVGFAALEKLSPPPGTPIVFLATAHSAKFGDAIARALGFAPPLPPALKALLGGAERCTVLPNDVAAVRNFILARTGRQ